jgi:hypothetical protein
LSQDFSTDAACILLLLPLVLLLLLLLHVVCHSTLVWTSTLAVS